MEIRTGYDFEQSFHTNPLPVVLLGTRGYVTAYRSYIKCLSRLGIAPRYIASDEPEKVGKRADGIRIVSYEIFQKDAQASPHYVLLTSSAQRFQNNDSRFCESLQADGIVYQDFPFDIPREEWPCVRFWDDQRQWFYDLFYSGIPAYDKDPKQYVTGVFSHKGLTVHNGRFVMADYCNDFVHIEKGIRRTPFQPEEFKHDVYLCGNCVAYGTCADDARTVPAFLQLKCNKLDPEKGYRFHNWGAVLAPVANTLYALPSMRLKPGDKVILISHTFFLYDPKEQDCPTVAEYSRRHQRDFSAAFCETLCAIQDYCKEHGAEFWFFEWSGLNHVQNPSNFERQFMKKTFRTVAEYKAYSQKLQAAGKDAEALPDFSMLEEKSSISFSPWLTVNMRTLQKFCVQKGIRYLKLSEAFQRPHEFFEVFLDAYHPYHPGVLGYALIADEIYRAVFQDYPAQEAKQQMQSSNARFFDIIDGNVLTPELKEYLNLLQSASQNNPEQAGVIVMNCNPFTLGHRYLIEQALERVPYLYLLVVEENRSVFSFPDRMNMVKAGTEDLERVCVLPSGQFVISAMTFPEYFTKEKNPTVQIDASQDIFLFARYIAPALKAAVRFVGEEPFDPVTEQYNRQMKDQLRRFGSVDLQILPRKESGGTAISATRGREYLRTGNHKGMETVFPASTIQYLQEHGIMARLREKSE